VSELARKRLRTGRLAIVVVTSAMVALIVSRALVGLYVDALWFGEVGYSSVFWRNLAWVWGARAVIALLVGGAIFANLRVVAASLGTLQIRRRFGNLEIAERLPKHYITGGVMLLSALLGLWFGASVPEGVARSVLLWVHAPEWGATDPFLGRDLGFYVFLVPILRAAVTTGLVVGFLVLAVTVAGYVTTGTFQVGQGGLVITEQARRHLGLLVAIFLLLLAARFALGRPLLLFNGTSDIPGLFGYTDHNARFPALRVLTVATVVGAVGVLVGAWRNQVVPVLAGLAALVVGGVVGGQLYPYLVQRFAVVPNELGRETPYLEENLRFTREGFGLSDLQRSDFDAVPGGQVDWSLALERFEGLPVWGADALLTTFRERQARFRYYDFSRPEIDRYDSPEGPVPVALAVREVETAQIEDPNWQNLHLRERFVVGNGVVATAAVGRTEEWGPIPYVSGLPPERSDSAPAALSLRRTSIFFPSESQTYGVLNPTDSSFLAPDGTPGVTGVDYPEGISLGGFLRKLALAWHLQETNLLFAGEVNPDSRLVLHRGVRERVQRIAPFLRFPESPYPVIDDGRVTWIMEGFTATRYFPLARPFDLEFRRAVAYVRNSVKVTVDAVTGEVNLYARPVDDPLLDGWRAAYPGLFKPLEEMPAGLRTHLRYPRSLLDVQSRVLLQYHQETPRVFFLQEEAWALSQELAQSTSPVSYLPEYAILQLPGDSVPHFQVNTVFVPDGRQNLTGLLSGRLDEEGRSVLRLLDFPISEELPGPRQVEAYIEQNPEISEQFSLWRQGGSSVWTGHLHVVPLGQSVVYMEPVFLAAEDNAIPELRRFVVSDGQQVAMDETLAGAVAALAGGALSEALQAETTGPSASPSPSGGEVAGEALQILEDAESRLREGDYAGFGEALDRLRRVLQAMDSTGVAGG
jgi:uncharacterized membrane protein (UPF0182 family)